MAHQVKVDLATIPYSTDLADALDKAPVSLAAVHASVKKRLGGSPDADMLKETHRSATAGMKTFMLTYDLAVARCKETKSKKKTQVHRTHVQLRSFPASVRTYMYISLQLNL